MKHNYKNAFAIGLMAMLMISAQGAEAHHPPKTKQSNWNYNNNYSEHHRPSIRKTRHDVHRRYRHEFKHGNYNTRSSYNYGYESTPIGARVMYLPRGTYRIRTQRGFLYEYNGTLFRKSMRSQGFVIVKQANRRRAHRKNHH